MPGAFLSEEGRRTAYSVRRDLTAVRFEPDGTGYLTAVNRARIGGCLLDEGVAGRRYSCWILRIVRAARWCAKSRLAGTFILLCGIGHGAMVGTVAAATCRQARIFDRPEYRSRRVDQENQSEEDGQSAPHLQMMLYEGSAYRSMHESIGRSGMIDVRIFERTIQNIDGTPGENCRFES
jgi:hypothetical protein